MYNIADNVLGFATNAIERLRIINSGNVGIGTSSPSQPLHVSGNARITGAIYDSNNDPGTGGQILSSTATGTDWIAATSGTVTSVGLTMPTGFSVTGSPVTSTGTLAVSTTLNGPLRGNGSGFTTGNTNLASEVTGTLPVANGGTGATTLTANKVLVGNGTSAITQATNLHWDNTNSRLGISQTSPAYPLDISATSAIRLPVGTLAQQPTAATGLLRYTSNSSTIEWSDGSNWYTGISGEGNGPSASFNRVALWSGTSTQTSDADMTFNITTGQLKLLKYSSGTAFTGTSVAQLHVTSTGEVITKTPRDTVYVHLVAVTPGTAITQTAGTDFYQSSYLVPEHLDGYSISRADYAITNSTATTGSLTVGLRTYNTSNSSIATNQMAVTFSNGDVRKSSTSSLSVVKGYWLHAEVGTSNGTLNNTVEGLLITLMLTK